MLSFLNEKKKNCTGCYACYSSCPVDCIEMKKDLEGFWYPSSTDKCIHCGMCERVCPVINNNTNDQGAQKAYAAVTKDKEIWRRSASGGAFSEICKVWDSNDAIFVGATYDGLDVKHICIEDYHDIETICKSKYVQSEIGNTFIQIKKHLCEMKNVVFCGTPCQVAGLKNYLNQNFDNLLTIDLICHGVGAPNVFKECCNVIGENLDKEIISYEFRAKRKIYDVDYMQKVITKQGEEIYLLDDPYIQLFLSQNCTRPSCGENCSFRNEKRYGDITIADFKGLTKIFPKLSGTKRNYSTIVSNTPKGDRVVKELKKNMRVLECSVDYIKEYNPLFYRQSDNKRNQDEFIKLFEQNPQKAISEYTKPLKLQNISFAHKVYDLLPFTLRHIIIESIGFIKNEK